MAGYSPTRTDLNFPIDKTDAWEDRQTLGNYAKNYSKAYLEAKRELHAALHLRHELDIADLLRFAAEKFRAIEKIISGF